MGYVPNEPSRKASPLFQACDCLQEGHIARLSPIGRVSQDFGSVISPVAMASLVNGHRIMTRTVFPPIWFIGYLTRRPSKPRTAASARSHPRAVSLESA